MRKSSIKQRQALYVTEVNFFFFFKARFPYRMKPKDLNSCEPILPMRDRLSGPVNMGSNVNVFTQSLTFFSWQKIYYLF